MNERIVVIVRKIEIYTLIFLGVGSTVIMFINAVCRYCLSTTFVWAEEIIRIMFVWSMFVAISDSFIHNEHIGFKNLADLNGVTRFVSGLIYNASLVLVGALLAWYGWKYDRMTGSVPLSGTNLPTSLFMWPGIGAGIVWTVTGIVHLIKIFSGLSNAENRGR
jgi:TRAP-type C4-dicarboxylate transport system permease small subunit